ncbi:MAG: nitroreductase [Bacillota bacterium]|nr:MAG: nitroreductase [Bacillota bacterium]MBS3949314.1 nitroreductase family protein [Peptococcaceae bacterium]
MNLMEAITKRRSIRNYAPTLIPREILDEILEAARLAPSGGNGQNCCYGVVTDEHMKRKLAQAAGGQMWIAEAPVVIAFCANIEYNTANLPEDDFSLAVNRLRYGREMLDYLSGCKDKRGLGIMWANACPLIPGTHITLAATNHGLDTCWIGYLDVAKAGEILSLPSNMACFYLMPLGYAAVEPKKKSTRKPVEEVVFYDKWEAR